MSGLENFKYKNWSQKAGLCVEEAYLWGKDRRIRSSRPDLAKIIWDQTGLYNTQLENNDTQEKNKLSVMREK